MTENPSLKILHTPLFHADVRRDDHYTCKGMVYAKMFYGEMVLFFGGMASPLNSSTGPRYPLKANFVFLRFINTAAAVG